MGSIVDDYRDRRREHVSTGHHRRGQIETPVMPEFNQMMMRVDGDKIIITKGWDQSGFYIVKDGEPFSGDEFYTWVKN